MKRIGYMPPRTYHFRPQSRTPQPCAYRFRPRVGRNSIRPTNVFGRKRMPQSRTYHFHPRVGAYCIRPIDVFGRKRMPCICVIHFRMYTGFVRFRVIRARVHETVVRFCTYSPRSGSFVGRIQYAPTRGHKMVMRNGGICFRVHEIFMHIGLSLFFGR